MKIAFIVQRYGTEILGGSEYHCRLIAERLAEHHHQVDVLTTCARDYITWENVYPEGTDRVRGVMVRRFANARTRDLDAFNQYSDWIFNNRHTPADEMEWLKQQGPWSPGLIDYLHRQHQTNVEGAAHVAVQLDRQPAHQHVINPCIGQRLEQFGNLHGTDERMLHAPS